MGLAETAVLAVELKLNGQTVFSSGIAKSEASVAALNRTTAASGGHLSALVSAAGKAERGVVSLGGAFGHAAGKVGGLLSGPLGLIGLSAGIFSLGGIIEGSVKKLEDFTLGLEAIQGLTGETALASGALLLEFQKFGLSADRTAQIAGFAEKTLGKLNEATGKGTVKAGDLTKAQDALAKAHERVNLATLKLSEAETKKKVTASQLAAAHIRLTDATRTLSEAETKLAGIQAALATGPGSSTKLQEIDKKYGLSLIDTKGHVVDFSTELAQIADLYDRSIPPSEKAYVASQVFGRGYAALIPILQQGSAGIREAAAEAGALGLNLGGDTVAKMNAFRDQMRTLGEQVNIVQLQIGMALVPVISELAATTSKWLSTGGSVQIVKFFRDGAQFAQDFGKVVQNDVLPIFSGIASAWKAVPDDLKKVLIGGFVADKAGKFLFDKSLFGGITGGIKGIVESILGRVPGVSNVVGAVDPGQRVFVTNFPIGFGAAGVAGGALETVAAVAGGSLALTVALSAGTLVALGLAFVSAMQQVPDIVPLDQGGTPGQAFSRGHGFGPVSGHGQEFVTPFDAPTSTGAFSGQELLTRPTAGYQDKLDAQIFATQANTAALKLNAQYTSDQLHAIFAKSAAARGITLTPGFTSTSLAPRFAFLAAGHAGSKDAAVADALAAHFLTGTSPLYTSDKNLATAIKALQTDAKTLHGGDRKAIEHDIAVLKTEQARRLKESADRTARASMLAGVAAAQAIRDKNLSVTIPVTNQTATYINGRLLDANLSRYTSVTRNYGSGLGPGGA